MHRVWNVLKYFFFSCFCCSCLCILVDGVGPVCCEITQLYSTVFLINTSCCLCPLCLNTLYVCIALALNCVGTDFDAHTVIRVILFALHASAFCTIVHTFIDLVASMHYLWYVLLTVSFLFIVPHSCRISVSLDDYSIWVRGTLPVAVCLLNCVPGLPSFKQ